MLLSVLFSGVPAFSMLPPMFRFGAKVVGVSGLSAATSVASVMGFDYYKNRQLVFSPDFNQPVMAPVVMPEPSLPLSSMSQDKFTASSDQSRILLTMLEASTKATKDMSTAFMSLAQKAQAGDRKSQGMLTAGTVVTVAAVGVASYYGYKAGKNMYAHMCTALQNIKKYSLTGWLTGNHILGGKIDKLETQAETIIANIAQLNADLTHAIQNGNKVVVGHLSLKIKQAQAQLEEKITAIKQTIEAFSSKTDLYQQEMRDTIKNLDTQLEVMKNSQAATLAKLESNQVTQAEALARVESNQATQAVTLARIESHLLNKPKLSNLRFPNFMVSQIAPGILAGKNFEEKS